MMGKPLLYSMIVALVWSSAAVAQDAPEASGEAAPPAEPGEAEAPPDDGATGEGIEFVDEGPNPFDNDDALNELPEPQEEVDEVAPTIDDFAVAAGSPDAPVRVTAVVTDDASGIEAVEILYKVDDGREFTTVTLEPQQGGLFMGILPDGPQRTGFVYYAQARDAAGNVTVLGDPNKPYEVKAARETGIQRLERVKELEQDPEKEPTVAPIWIAATLGVGVIGAAGGALFLVDFARLWFVLLPQATPGSTREAEIQQLALGDAIIGGVLGAIGAAALLTGAGLLIFTAFEE